MAVVNVDTDALNKIALEIEDYISLEKNLMKQLGNIDFSKVWKGDEYTAFIAKYNEICNSTKTNKKYLEMMDKYAKYLKTCSKKYLMK